MPIAPLTGTAIHAHNDHPFLMVVLCLITKIKGVVILMNKDDELRVEEAAVEYNRKYTVEEYQKFREHTRAELHEGTIVVMESPTRKHQGVLANINYKLRQFLEGKTCKVYTSSFSVRLNEKENSFFEPDIVVVCDEKKLTVKGCLGAPDMIVEILSPSTSLYDRKYKFNKYQEAGVREYWIVDPEIDMVTANTLENGGYIGRFYTAEDTVPVTVLQGCEINLADVFNDW